MNKIDIFRQIPSNLTKPQIQQALKVLTGFTSISNNISIDHVNIIDNLLTLNNVSVIETMQQIGIVSFTHFQNYYAFDVSMYNFSRTVVTLLNAIGLPRMNSTAIQRTAKGGTSSQLYSVHAVPSIFIQTMFQKRSLLTNLAN